MSSYLQVVKIFGDILENCELEKLRKEFNEKNFWVNNFFFFCEIKCEENVKILNVRTQAPHTEIVTGKFNIETLYKVPKEIFVVISIFLKQLLLLLLVHNTQLNRNLQMFRTIITIILHIAKKEVSPPHPTFLNNGSWLFSTYVHSSTGICTILATMKRTWISPALSHTLAKIS